MQQYTIHYRAIPQLTRSQFHAMWGTHHCEAKGCGEWLTCDGGMKPRRYCHFLMHSLVGFLYINFQQCVRSAEQWGYLLQAQLNQGCVRLYAEAQSW